MLYFWGLCDLLRIENGILRLIASGASTEDIANRLCRDVEAKLPGISCAIWRTDATGASQLLSAPGLSRQFPDLTDDVLIAPDVASPNMMFESQDIVSVADVMTSSSEAPATDFGFHACWASPILSEDAKTIGILALYLPERRSPSNEESACIAASRELCEIAMRCDQRGDEHTRQADIDALTGLPNRAAFEKALARQRCDVSGAWALLVIDLDNLKTINDVFGHKAGDELIRTVGRRIAQTTAPDVTFRLGGDEFVVIIEQEESLCNLERAAHSIFAALDVSALCDGQVVVPTATIGGAVFDLAEGGVENVYQNADFALYHAKETGRGGFVRYWPGIGSRMIRRRSVVRDVASALEEQRIEAHYQPLLRLDTHEIIGVETLCRMRMPSGELQSARSFKEALKDAKVATDLTSRMLSIIASDLDRWRRQGVSPPPVGLNVSTADFYAGDLLSKLQATFGPIGVPLGHVVLEVSEAVSSGSGDKVVVRQVERLRAHGVKVALDDFGSGHASLTHLLAMPVDAIKIARSFIARQWPEDPGVVVVKGLINIARQLDIHVVAQGIETEVQASELWTMGCTHGQGFELSRPADGDAIARLLRQRGQGIAEPTPLQPSLVPLLHDGGRRRYRPPLPSINAIGT
ncbi:MAG: hypothetical protein ABS76_38595 [Pelagibacterium sp. SCN 64-44]|nr:MAG: hypothetical protein ABS76_38595 [Pelagibacterium sp. SCN 64-44]